jgi:hypothetical protein
VSQPALFPDGLRISEPNDRHEQEADRVADSVMRMPHPQLQRQVEPEEEEEEEALQTKPLGSQITPLLQRQEEEPEEEEEELIQPKPLVGRIMPMIQRQLEPEEEEEESIQTKLLVGRTTAAMQRQVEPEEEEELVQTKGGSERIPQVGPAVQVRIESLRGRGQPLSESARSFFEPRFQHSFASVRVHAGSEAAQAAQRVRARAFTVGSDIVFGAGQYAPDTIGGRRLLAHELTHVIQQRDGRARHNVIQRALWLAYGAYRGSCDCSENLGNNCAHYLSDALIRAGYGELDGGKGGLYRRRNGRIVCKSGRPVRAKEMRDWFASKAIDTRTNEPEADIPDGYWAVYQERARDGQGHVLLHHHTGGSYSYRGTGDYPTWRTQIHYSIPSAPGDWNLPSGDTRLA